MFQALNRQELEDCSCLHPDSFGYSINIQLDLNFLTTEQPEHTTTDPSTHLMIDRGKV